MLRYFLKKSGSVGGGSPQACAQQCKRTNAEAAATATAVFAAERAGVRYGGFGRDREAGCEYFSFSAGCDECWLFRSCGAVDRSPDWVYNWSTYELL